MSSESVKTNMGLAEEGTR